MVSSDAELPVGHQASRASRASLTSKQLTVSLAKEAKDFTEAHMDEMLRHGDIGFQVADECLGTAWNYSAVACTVTWFNMCNCCCSPTVEL